MPKPPVKSSAYAEYLYRRIDEFFLQQGSTFTIQELAVWCGLKPTTNFRRRVRHAVVAGKLDVFTGAEGDGNRAFRYMQHTDLDRSEIPF